MEKQVKASKTYNIANCAELARLVFNFLRRKNIRKAEIFRIADRDHVIVVIDREGDIDSPPNTWGKNCTFIDALNDKVFNAADVYEELKRYEFDDSKPDPHVISPFTQEDQLELCARIECKMSVEENRKQINIISNKLAIIRNACKEYMTSTNFASFQALENEIVLPNEY